MRANIFEMETAVVRAATDVRQPPLGCLWSVPSAHDIISHTHTRTHTTVSVQECSTATTTTRCVELKLRAGANRRLLECELLCLMSARYDQSVNSRAKQIGTPPLPIVARSTLQLKCFLSPPPPLLLVLDHSTALFAFLIAHVQHRT